MANTRSGHCHNYWQWPAKNFQLYTSKSTFLPITGLFNFDNYFLFLCTLGTPEIGGLTSIQGIEILRGCRGMNIVGGDMVEVIKLNQYMIILELLLCST